MLVIWLLSVKLPSHILLVTKDISPLSSSVPFNLNNIL